MATRRQPGRGLHRLLRDHLQRCPLRHLYLCRLQNGLQQRRTGLPHLHREVAPRQHRAERHLDQLAAAIQQNKLHLPRRRGLRPPLRRDQGGGLDAHSHLTPHLDLQLQAGHRRRLLALGGLQPDEEYARSKLRATTIRDQSCYKTDFFDKQLIGNVCSIKVADDWIRIPDLWCWKQLLCQLSHNHCPDIFALSLLICNVQLHL